MAAKKPKRIIVEGGIIAGNVYDKYSSKNPVTKYLLRKFLESADALIERTGATRIHEIGCGEGQLAVRLAERGRTVCGYDFSTQIITKAKAQTKGQKNVTFKVASIYELTPEKDAAELIVCCEVLEHLEDPERALGILQLLAKPHLLVSVPREPIWSAMNIMRGSYLRDLGNTPGHIRRWSRRQFLAMLKRYVRIIEVRTPIPWTMALCTTDARGG